MLHKLTLLVPLTLLVCWLVACAPQRTIPKGMPYPRSIKPGLRVYPIEKVRCMGTMLGGCSPLNIRH
jgi:hypothetical protein